MLMKLENELEFLLNDNELFCMIMIDYEALLLNKKVW